jgi:uncharacterized membrane protein
MKVLKYILFGVLGIVVLAAIAALFMKKDFHFEKSAEINAPKDVVWEYVSKFSKHETWSQWKKMDPKMKVELSGVDGTVGSKMSWTSDHSQVGNGSQTISNIIPGERVDVQLDFGDNGKPTSFYTFSGDSTNCKVTWGMDMHMNYPFNIMGPMMDGWMDEMFVTGLNMLKDASEQRK